MDVISNLPLPATGLKSALPGPTAQPSVSDAPADAYYGSVEGPDPGLYRPFLPSVPRYTADTEKPKGLPAQQAQPPVAGRSRQEIARRAEIMKGMIQEETGIDGKADEKLAALLGKKK